MPVFTLSHRSVVRVSGPEAMHFLDNLVTCDIEKLGASQIVPGALLSPQGKILFDFLASRDGDGYRLECRADIAAELMKRLKFYRLRAKVEIALEEQELVAASFGVESGSSESESSTPSFRDVRFPASAMATRIYSAAADAGAGSYDGLRIENGVAEGGFDYDFGDAFPHDVNLDQIKGVSFSKGCYVGQEVVSRMQHRGTARRRIVIARSLEMISEHTAITAAGRPIGVLGTTVASNGLALVRIDKVKDAMDAGTPIMAGEVAVELELPAHVNFNWPKAGGVAE
jgi:tRNA-modifying protein YgfZ